VSSDRLILVVLKLQVLLQQCQLDTWSVVHVLHAHVFREGVGNHFSAKGHLDIYNIIRGPYKIINLKISLLYLVKHLINSPLM
jgi:hypothetical protein